MKSNNKLQNNLQTAQDCTAVDISKKSEQDKTTVLNEQPFISTDKETELFLKLHVANHKPG